MNFVYKKNKFIFQNILFFFILLILMISIKSSVFALVSENNNSEEKMTSNKSKEELILEKSSRQKSLNCVNDFISAKEDYQFFKKNILDFMDENQQKAISKKFAPKLNEYLMKFKNEVDSSPEKMVENICSYLSAILFSVSIERSELTYNFFFFGEPFLR
ncbi:MAG: putative secreted protein [Candidatus Phytoplasma cynodontis]|nr:MAG: putative secreted protein [Candidatus Phytoplasma cynodontis]